MTDFTDFKSRQRNTQLPADPGKTYYVGSENIKRADEALDRTPLGSPPANCDVRSVYDARPINAYDPHIVVESAESVGPTFDLEFQSREGYVLVIRAIHHWFEPAPALPFRSDVLLTLFLNGAAQPDLINIPVGVESDGLVTPFLVCDELNTIRARLTCSAAIPSATAWVMFYGNYLQKTAVPANQQIANCVGNFPPRVVPPVVIETPPKPMLPAPPTPTPVQRPPREFRCQIDPRGTRTVWIRDPTMTAGVTGQWRLPTTAEQQLYAVEIAATACGGSAAKR